MSGASELQLDLLIFSVGEVHYGIDTEQVAAVQSYNNEHGEDLVWFHEALGYCDRPAVYSSPAVVTVRTGYERQYRVIIDSMEDIATFSRNDIRLLPPLLEPFALQKGIWGVLPRNGNLVLLVDFLRLKYLNSSHPLHKSTCEREKS